ncbi:diguanylate cyclase [Rhizobium helianthi]|uniref:diguanylate cyclase n=1 Tax=Rhizobium helianthi TaxID=1132695 RepID=A0ABW4LY16_9HYPH
MDTKTALVLWATEAMTLAALLVASWLHDRKQVVTGLWGLGFACHGAGIVLVGLRNTIPDFVSIVLSNLIILLGIGLWGAGVLRHDGRRVTPVLLLPSLLWITLLLIPSVYEQFWARVVLVQTCSSLAYLLLAYCLITGQKPASRSRRLFALVSVIQAGFMLNMAVQSAVLRPTTFMEMPNVLIYSVGNIFCLVAAIMLGARMLMARSEERLRHIALTDPLTGVLNRRGLLDQFDRVRRESSGQRGLLAIIIFDLDHFKQINDQYGHRGGDDVLTHFCRVAQSCLMQRGVFGRLGGEEFACLLAVSSDAEAIGTTEAIRLTLFSQPITSEDNRLIRASVSAGIAVAPRLEADLDSMLSRADRALYAAKAAGRNRSAINDSNSIVIVPGSEKFETSTAQVPPPATLRYSA